MNRFIIYLFLVLIVPKFIISQNIGKGIDFRKYNKSQGGIGNIEYSNIGIRGVVLGDIDKNGFNDYVIGAYDGITNDEILLVTLMDRNNTVLKKVIIASGKGGFPANSLYLGFRSITNIGDLDNDGINDVAVGYPGGGIVYIFYFNSDGTIKTNIPIINSSSFPVPTQSSFGSEVSNLGDLDGDGVQDLVIGDYSDNNSQGALYILFLRRDGGFKSFTKISSTQGGFKGNLATTNAQFGSSISPLGDLNNDSIPDLIVTSQTGSAHSSNYIGNSNFWVLFLNRNGSVKTHSKISYDSGNIQLVYKPFLDIGYPKNLGDINGDGRKEIIISIANDSISNKKISSLRILFLDTNGVVDSIVNPMDSTFGIYTQLNNGSLIFPFESNFDFNGDYKNDLLIGDQNNVGTTSNEGAFFLVSLDGEKNLVIPHSRFTAKDTTGIVTKTFTLNNTSSGYPKQVKWSFTPNTISYQNGTTENSLDSVQVKFNAAGKYTVQLWVQNPFGQDSLLKTNYINVSPVGGIEETLYNPFKVYPIPATDEIFISSSENTFGQYAVSIQNYLGETVNSKELLFSPNLTQHINIDKLPQGLYFLTISNSTIGHTLKFIK